MRCAFVTFGCRINQYDTQAIREAILELGYEEVSPREPADLFILNACTVTARAGEKSAQSVRRFARRNPRASILVTGCMTPEDRAVLEKIPGVRYLVGNEEKDQIPALIQGHERIPTRGRRSRRVLNLAASQLEGHTRAFLKIQDGCDNFCTFCIIPFLRGKSKSRPVDDVLAEATRMAASGHREVVLAGVHLSDYGRDLGDGEADLVDLLQRLRRVRGLDRLRLSSTPLEAFDERLLALFFSDPGFCPYFHIPLQSGSGRILERMRRGYTVGDYLGRIGSIRTALPRAVFASDLIVGFPGETDEDFEASLRVCREVGFAKIHLFPYSLRPGTKAAQMDGHVPARVKDDRMARARGLELDLAAAERRRWIGRRARVLVEKQGDGVAEGLTREGLRVRVQLREVADLVNEEIEVELTAADEAGLDGEWVRA